MVSWRGGGEGFSTTVATSAAPGRPWMRAVIVVMVMVMVGRLE